MAKTFSGERVIKILVKHFGFIETGVRGSHVKLKKINGRTVVTVVPLHKELALGTLRGVLRLAEVDYKDFLKTTRRK